MAGKVGEGSRTVVSRSRVPRGSPFTLLPATHMPPEIHRCRGVWPYIPSWRGQVNLGVEEPKNVHIGYSKIVNEWLTL